MKALDEELYTDDNAQNVGSEYSPEFRAVRGSDDRWIA